MQPLFVEIWRLVFERIQAHTRKTDLVVIPFTPVIQLFTHLDVAVVNIAEHQIVVISHLVTDHIFPAVAMTVHNAINGVLVFTFGIIHARKAHIVPFEIGILIAAPGECELSVAAYFIRIGQRHVTIFRINFNHLKLLQLVATRLVIEHNIDNRADPFFA